MKNIWLVALLLFAWSCKTTKNNALYEPITLMEERVLDTLVVSAPAIDKADVKQDAKSTPVFERPVYRSSAKRENDLLHTRLEVQFDWKTEKVFGKATLDLKPYFYPTDSLTLDAKGFEISNIQLVPAGRELEYEYDGQQLKIKLDRTYQRNETYTVNIDYTATPSATGGSNAIKSDKGLFFINPRGEDPDKPQQIWTQGETQNNSRWFPTIDRPNERFTQEIFITVDDKYTTLSNGTLQSSTQNENGMRTDHWKMDQPHAPYLCMIAVGEYAVVRDQWEDILLEYYVEPEYEQDAKAIFPHTPEMLAFFSDVLGVKYPWSKFSQIIVRDYVSGAMENTTAVVYLDKLQMPARELIDETINESYVAHEMFHHWFGDLVTCESWANLTLNEAFATYGEYLWFEYKYGKDEADYHLLGEWNYYLSTTKSKLHPLVDFSYRDREDMFDSHSYQKGGAILHMLRYYVGDEAFFAALNKYLVDNQFQTVEAHIS